MIVLSVGMYKAGTGWYFNLTNELLIAAGYRDVHGVRDQYRLHSVLERKNCTIRRPTLLNLGRVTIPHLLGNTFVIKTHRELTTSLRCFIASGIIKATFIYRDPRDTALSAFEHGQRIRRKGETHSFARLDTLEKSIHFTKQHFSRWDKWMQSGLALIVRYENLLADPLLELERLTDFLSISVPRPLLQQVVTNYQKGNVFSKEKLQALHFHKGIVGRFREVMSAEELSLCDKYFRDHLEKMGYR